MGRKATHTKPPKELLEEMRKCKTLTEMAAEFGVCLSTMKRWLDSYSIYRTYIQKPDKYVLEEMRLTMHGYEIANELGVSRDYVYKWLHQDGITSTNKTIVGRLKEYCSSAGEDGVCIYDVVDYLGMTQKQASFYIGYLLNSGFLYCDGKDRSNKKGRLVTIYKVLN